MVMGVKGLGNDTLLRETRDINLINVTSFPKVLEYPEQNILDIDEFYRSKQQ